MTPYKINRKYKPRILANLRKIAELLSSHGFKVSGPDDMTDEDYSYWLLVEKDQMIDIRFTILESEHSDGEVGGVNFACDITEVSGRTLGGICPFNYTNKVWVPRKDEAAIEERFKLLEDADINGIVDCCSS